MSSKEQCFCVFLTLIYHPNIPPFCADIFLGFTLSSALLCVTCTFCKLFTWSLLQHYFHVRQGPYAGSDKNLRFSLECSAGHGAFHILSLPRIFHAAFLFVSFFKPSINLPLSGHLYVPLKPSETSSYTQDCSGNLSSMYRYLVGLKKVLLSIYSSFHSDQAG